MAILIDLLALYSVIDFISFSRRLPSFRGKQFRRDLTSTDSFRLLEYLFGILPAVARDTSFIKEILDKKPRSMAEWPTGPGRKIEAQVNERFDSEYQDRKRHSNGLIRFSFNMTLLVGAAGAGIEVHGIQVCVNSCIWSPTLAFFVGVMVSGFVLSTGSRLLMKP